jgi:hypothetical protein
MIYFAKRSFVKIVIVGGGSSGWMSASILIKTFPNYDVSVVQSPKISNIGVGESTYDGINYFIEYLNIDKKDFFNKTNASIKLGVKFKNFYKKNDTPFLYPFGNPYLLETFWGMQDWMIKKYVYPNTLKTDFIKSYFPCSHLIENNTFNENINGELENFDSRIDTALHFDAEKFSLWLKNEYCIPRNVNYIAKEVIDIKTYEGGIEKLIFEDGSEIYADLFIDCTGFKSLLLDKTMKEKFVNYENFLPNNRAWATQIEYKNKRIELDSVTTCTAIENGWCWNTPLWSRLGAGYVYSDKYVDPETAKEEFKKYLMSSNMIIPRTKEEINSLEFKDIKMRVGIHERIFVKNVVGIGLSAGFIEPLEGNGLFTVHEFLFELIKILKREKISEFEKFVFNSRCREIYESFANFIKLHYVLSIREDTKYWKNIFNLKYSFDNFSFKTKKQNIFQNLYDSKTKTGIPLENGFDLASVCIATGMEYYILDDVLCKRGEISYNAEYKNSMDPWFKKLEEKKEKWNNIAKNSLSLHDYLEKKYYS